MKRILSAILLLAMSASVFTACADNQNSDDTDTDTSVSADDTTPAGPTLELPEDLDYSGSDPIRILTAEGILHGSNEEEATSLSLAIYEQFLATSERLSVEFEHIDVFPYSDAAKLVQQSIGAQSDDYDLVFTVAQDQIALINEGYFTPIEDLPYIDLDNPWWNKGYIESVSLNASKPYTLFGSITYNSVQRTTCVFFNKRIMEQVKGLSDMDVYEMVFDGTWTIDKFVELTKDVYIDDGNTVSDMADVHGIVYSGGGNMEYLAFSAGVEYTDRDEDGYPVLNLNTDKAFNVAETLLEAFIGPDAYKPTSEDGTNAYAVKFGDGNALFTVNRLFLAGWTQLREMKDDFGILPMPKYDESIDGYHSVTGNMVQWGTVPVTVSDPVKISAVAESLAYEGYMRVIPAYYENDLKLKYTRGDLDTESQILDMITEGARTDFLYLNKLGGLGNIFARVCNYSQNVFASQYAANEVTALTQLEALIENDKNR